MGPIDWPNCSHSLRILQIQLGGQKQPPAQPFNGDHREENKTSFHVHTLLYRRYKEYIVNYNKNPTENTTINALEDVFVLTVMMNMPEKEVQK
jgi:hypothetical protein